MAPPERRSGPLGIDVIAPGKISPVLEVTRERYASQHTAAKDGVLNREGLRAPVKSIMRYPKLYEILTLDQLASRVTQALMS
jgi:hypothetical protein